ncbi:MAG TPA: hypothetical protein ENJ77_00960 [Candidatus Moranbacteria bacterium]|nr:hypothetical protein [Candidatus Moranbacteria bacterium]
MKIFSSVLFFAAAWLLAGCQVGEVGQVHADEVTVNGDVTVPGPSEPSDYDKGYKDGYKDGLEEREFQGEVVFYPLELDFPGAPVDYASVGGMVAAQHNSAGGEVGCFSAHIRLPEEMATRLETVPMELVGMAYTDTGLRGRSAPEVVHMGASAGRLLGVFCYLPDDSAGFWELLARPAILAINEEPLAIDLWRFDFRVVLRPEEAKRGVCLRLAENGKAIRYDFSPRASYGREDCFPTVVLPEGYGQAPRPEPRPEPRPKPPRPESTPSNPAPQPEHCKGEEIPGPDGPVCELG